MTPLVSLEYAAPAPCPGQERFWESVAHAAPDLRLASEGEQARHYRVAIQPSTAGFRGELTEQGQPEPRRLEAADCAELAEALALMLVLSTEAAPLPTEPAPASSAPAPAPAPAAARATFAAAPSAPSAPFDADATPEPVAATRGSGVALGALVWWGAAPDPLLGVAVGLQRAFGPLIVARLEARAAFANALAAATYVGLAPQACAHTRWSVVEVAACVGAAVGTLNVEGVEYAAPAQSRAWLAPTLGARVSAPLADPLLVELSVEGEHAFVQRNFRVKSDDSQFRTPAFSALLTLAFGARF